MPENERVGASLLTAYFPATINVTLIKWLSTVLIEILTPLTPDLFDQTMNMRVLGILK